MRKMLESWLSDLKGYPIFNIEIGKKYPFSFGVPKAKAILANIDQLKAFVEANEEAHTINKDGHAAANAANDRRTAAKHFNQPEREDHDGVIAGA